MIYRTYDEWQELDFGVIKGEKSHKRNEEGVAVFGGDQVNDHYMDALTAECTNP